MNRCVLHRFKWKNKYNKIWEMPESKNPFLSCLPEEEHWCKKALSSYKPHELHYLTSTRLLFTQNGPWLKQKLDGSLETMGREDENDEEEKEKKTQLHGGGERGERKTNGEIIKCSFILITYFSKRAKQTVQSVSWHCKTYNVGPHEK